jgi:hypothetical protein
LERSDKIEDKGGEADQIAEPPASGQKTVHKIDTAKAVWSAATK